MSGWGVALPRLAGRLAAQTCLRSAEAAAQRTRRHAVQPLDVAEQAGAALKADAQRDLVNAHVGIAQPLGGTHAAIVEVATGVTPCRALKTRRQW